MSEIIETTPKDITIADITLSYSDIIDVTGFSALSEKLAKQYLCKYSEPKKAARHLIRAFKSQIITTSLIMNSPHTSKSNVVKTGTATIEVLLQILMILSVARLAGLDPDDHEVQVFVMCKSVIASVSKRLQPYAVEFGTHMAEHLIDLIPREVIDGINDAAGYRAVTKHGATGTINLHNLAWVGGAAFGLLEEFSSTSYIGWRAYRVFFKKPQKPSAQPYIKAFEIASKARSSTSNTEDKESRPKS